jgi:3-hydroxyacyl-[acyl-carrier-protein] dehydratase
MQADDVEAMARAGRKRPLFEEQAAHRVDLGRPAIERLIQHRPPFLFVDHIRAVDLEGRTIVGSRRIDPADPVFVGHFPEEPIYPGVLQVESMGQLGLCLFALGKFGRTSVTAEDRPPPVRGLKIHHAAFIAPVRPGDELTMFAKEVESDDFTGTAAGQLYVGSTLCCFAIMEVYFVDT